MHLAMAIALLTMLLANALPAAPPPPGVDDLAEPGPYTYAGWEQVTVTRPDSSTFTARLYYPASSSGSGAPYDGSGAPYPVVSFGHGFLTSHTYYQSTLAHLATWGYFVIATTEGTATPGEDYLPVSGTLCFTPGVTVQVFFVPLISDTLPEGSETVTLSLVLPTNATIGEPGVAVVTIVDDDVVLAFWSYIPLVIKP